MVTTPTAKKKPVMKLDNISIGMSTISNHLAEKNMAQIYEIFLLCLNLACISILMFLFLLIYHRTSLFHKNIIESQPLNNTVIP